MEKKSFLQFLGRFFLFMFFSALFITTCVLINVEGPRKNVYSDSDWEDIEPYIPPGYNASKHNIILDQHTHSLYSDGVLTLKQSIEWHISMGFNAAVMTDHNTVENLDEIEDLQEEYEGEFLIIPGIEWTTGRIHMNMLGISEWDDEIPGMPTDKEIEDAIEYAHDQDAVATCNHIPWSLNQANMDTHPSRDDLKDWDIDFIEIVNDDSLTENVYDEKSIDFCEDNGIGQITGTDMHSPDGLVGGGVRGWTLLNASEFTVEAVMVELRERDTEIIYSEKAFVDLGVYSENPEYTPLKPLSNLGGIFVNLYYDGLDTLQIALTLGYIVIIFLIGELYRFIHPKFWERINAFRESRKKGDKSPKPPVDEKID